MIVVAYGGSGSTYLRLEQAPRTYADVRSLVDADLKPRFWPEGNLAPVDSYQDKPNDKVTRCFARRADRHMDPMVSIGANLASYVRGRLGEDCFTHLTFASYYRFFSRHRIPDVVFVVRHAVDQVVSYLHPELGTHGRRAGFDVRTAEGVSIFADVWWANVAEYRRLALAGLRPVLVRFDRPDDVLQLSPRQQKLFDGFDHGNTHRGVLPALLERRLNMLAAASGQWGLRA